MINAKKLPNVKSALELSGASVCVQSGTTTELNLADFFRNNKMQYNPVVFEALEPPNRPTIPAVATSTPPTSQASIRPA
jgi:general L-amino acid transport system substrate-binding protein